MQRKSEPKTIFIIRDNMEWVEGAFHQYIESIPKEAISKRKRHQVELFDGTRIIAMSRLNAKDGTRGYSNVSYA